MLPVAVRWELDAVLLAALANGTIRDIQIYG